MQKLTARVDTEKGKSTLVENILKMCVHLIPLVIGGTIYHTREFHTKITWISPDNVTEN